MGTPSSAADVDVDTSGSAEGAGGPLDGNDGAGTGWDSCDDDDDDDDDALLGTCRSERSWLARAGNPKLCKRSSGKVGRNGGP